jgi:hypothetical protein
VGRRAREGPRDADRLRARVGNGAGARARLVDERADPALPLAALNHSEGAAARYARRRRGGDTTRKPSPRPL